MNKLSLRELAVPIIKSIDSFNYLLKSHHRRTAVISYHIGKELNLSEESLFELIVTAALHDIGALSVQERDMLLREDVEKPEPHCQMGYRMLSSFEAFKEIAKTIKHHHINYKKSLDMEEGEVPYNSHIIHLADRVDILINSDHFILNQKQEVTQKIEKKVGMVFHPEVFDAFEKASKPDIFWIEINNLEVEQLFSRINKAIDYELSIDKTVDFALTLSRIIDFRSRYTASHSYTVAHLSRLIGSLFDFSEEDCKKLMIAGYLHDIGKIGIDPGLIEKKGPLKGDEYNMVKLHAYYTSQILKELNSSEWFGEIVKWASHHHEKSDGSGYPMSLTESSLDQGAKVLAFSDVISALMEKRPYRKGLPIEEVFDIIREKIAPNISSEMFNKIEQHSKEINDLIQQCQAHTFEEYSLSKSSKP